jgi:GNAT superfamily N-acetyltransferase
MSLPQAVQDFRDALMQGDHQAADEMQRYYQGVLDNLQPQINDVTQRLQAARQTGDTAKAINDIAIQKDQLEALQKTIQQEVGAFADYASGKVAILQRQAIIGGIQDAQQMLQGTVPEGVSWSWNAVPASAIEAQIGALQKGSPLNDLFDSFGPEAAAAAKQILVASTATGVGPRMTGYLLQDALNTPLQRALTIARTEQMRAYRTAQTLNYQANSDVVDAWIWLAALGPDCCSVCISMNGTEHTVDEFLDSHPNCKCTQVPKTKDWNTILDDAGIDTEGLDIPDTNPDIQNGSDWFKNQPESTQLAVLGPSKFALFQNGDLQISDLVHHGNDAQWGGYRREKSVAELGFSAKDVATAKAAQPVSDATQKAADKAIVQAAADQTKAIAEATPTKTPSDTLLEKARALHPTAKGTPEYDQALYDAAAAKGGDVIATFGTSNYSEKSFDTQMAEVHAAVKSIFGKDVTPQEIAALTGAPPGSYALIRSALGGRLEINVFGPGFEMRDISSYFDRHGQFTMTRVISRDASGNLVMYNDNFMMNEAYQGHGLGTKIFSDEVAALRQQGFDRIDTHGEAGTGYNGYYTWPRLGYTGDLPRMNVDLPPGLEHVKTVQELMATPEGRAWWKANGQAIDLTFDLTPGSYSDRVLNAYLDAKATKAAPVDPAQAKIDEAQQQLQQTMTDLRNLNLPDNILDEKTQQETFKSLATQEQRDEYFNQIGLAERNQTKFDDAQYTIAKAEADAAKLAGTGDGTVIVFNASPFKPGTIEEQIAATQEQIKSILGKDVTPQDLVRLVGATPESNVNIKINSKGQIEFYVRGPGYSTDYSESYPQYEMIRYLYRDAQGQLVMHNASFMMDDSAQGQGLGTKIFSDEVASLQQLGVSRIDTEAAGSPYNGYYTWPRLGYVGPLEEFYQDDIKQGIADGELPKKWAKYTTLQELMSTPEGREWWKDNGSTINLSFDLTPGSLSLKILKAYLKARGIK